MKQDPNLLVDLSRWADRQGENYSTDAFVHLLKHLAVHQQETAKRLLASLTGDHFPQAVDHWDEIRISTQNITENGTPDIRITAPGYLGYVEVKLSAALGTGQLASYRKALQTSSVGQSSLTLLTRYPYAIPSGEEPDVAIRWFQVAQWLEKELAAGELDPVSSYLTQQFLGYLEALNITIHQVRSGISKGLRDYMAKNGAPLTDGPRFRSPQKLLEHPELLPLYQLMLLLGEAVAGAGFKVKFDMGKHNRGWVGYNLNAMDYFLFIPLTQPEELVFETYRRPFDPDLWNGEVGQYRRDRQPQRWENVLDLADPKIRFFELEKAHQFELIQTFVNASLKEAEKCFPANPKDHEPT